MIITQQEFENQLAKNQLKLSLIGMSGIGKSFRSTQMKNINFEHICCDDLISEKVHNVPYINVTGLAQWMNLPYTDGYQDREKEYLFYEEQITHNAIDNMDSKFNAVIDTTGSVIYLSDKTKKYLRQKTLIVYLQTDASMYEQMFQIYMRDPKPVVWGKIFHQKPYEKNIEALKRCYPILVSSRVRKYEQLADVILFYQKEINIHWTANMFLDEVKKLLPINYKFIKDNKNITLLSQEKIITIH